jgi:ribosome-binding protein aMBF1 (putative translation factor)
MLNDMENSNPKIKDLIADSTLSNWAEKIVWRKANRDWLRKSVDIALRILDALDDLGWNKARLAKEMGVSPQQVSKYVKGEENFKLETICKLEKVLGIELITILTSDQEVVFSQEANVLREPPADEYQVKKGSKK